MEYPCSPAMGGVCSGMPSSRSRALNVLAVCAAVFAPLSARAGTLQLQSPDFSNGGVIPLAQAYDDSGCSGGNISPALRWRNAPAGTRSFAVTVFDPDAQGGQGFWHWVALDIPADMTALPANAGNPEAGLMPKPVLQLQNDWGGLGYGGPCPPQGQTHHYVFTVYALGAGLQGIGPGTSPDAAAAELRRHALASARLVAAYP